MEAVRTGNYWAEPHEQDAVLSYIAELHVGLLADQKWLAKNYNKLKAENGLSKRYSVDEILAKKHEADGFDVFVDPDEAVAAAEAAAKGPRPGPAELAPGTLGELQDGLLEIAASREGDGAAVSAEEVADLLEGCARAGETAAAVLCGEHLHELHGDDLPEPLVDRAFDALKPLLRRSARQAEPRLQGPWSQSQQQGTASSKALNSKLGRLLDRLARARRQRAIASGGPAAERAERAVEGRRLLGQLCVGLAPLLGADAEARACRRRGPLVAAVTRLCGERGLRVSYALSWSILQELERIGLVHARGREVELTAPAASAGAGAESKDTELGALAAKVGLLEELSREQLERKKKRQKSREQGRDAKRRRRGGD